MTLQEFMEANKEKRFKTYSSAGAPVFRGAEILRHCTGYPRGDIVVEHDEKFGRVNLTTGSKITLYYEVSA